MSVSKALIRFWVKCAASRPGWWPCAGTPWVSTPPSVDFAEVLRSSIEQVNTVQQTSQDLQKSASRLGDESVNLHDVMISLQKASLSFQTMVQVRNKLVTAQEIMNTQV